MLLKLNRHFTFILWYIFWSDKHNHKILKIEILIVEIATSTTSQDKYSDSCDNSQNRVLGRRHHTGCLNQHCLDSLPGFTYAIKYSLFFGYLYTTLNIVHMPQYACIVIVWGYMHCFCEWDSIPIRSRLGLALVVGETSM